MFLNSLVKSNNKNVNVLLFNIKHDIFKNVHDQTIADLYWFQ